jgi:hypothetical protein
MFSSVSASSTPATTPVTSTPSSANSTSTSTKETATAKENTSFNKVIANTNTLNSDETKSVKALRDNWDILPKNKDGLVSKDTLRSIENDPRMPLEVRDAAKFMRENPDTFNKVDVGYHTAQNGSDKADNQISYEDLKTVTGTPPATSTVAPATPAQTPATSTNSAPTGSASGSAQAAKPTTTTTTTTTADGTTTTTTKTEGTSGSDKPKAQPNGASPGGVGSVSGLPTGAVAAAVNAAGPVAAGAEVTAQEFLQGKAYEKGVLDGALRSHGYANLQALQTAHPNDPAPKNVNDLLSYLSTLPPDVKKDATVPPVLAKPTVTSDKTNTGAAGLPTNAAGLALAASAAGPVAAGAGAAQEFLQGKAYEKGVLDGALGSHGYANLQALEKAHPDHPAFKSVNDVLSYVSTLAPDVKKDATVTPLEAESHRANIHRKYNSSREGLQLPAAEAKTAAAKPAERTIEQVRAAYPSADAQSALVKTDPSDQAFWVGNTSEHTQAWFDAKVLAENSPGMDPKKIDAIDKALNPRDPASVQKAGNTLTQGTALFAGDEKASYNDLVQIAKGNPVKTGKPEPTPEETAAAKCLVANYPLNKGKEGTSTLKTLMENGMEKNGVELNLKEMKVAYPASTDKATPAATTTATPPPAKPAERTIEQVRAAYPSAADQAALVKKDPSDQAFWVDNTSEHTQAFFDAQTLAHNSPGMDDKIIAGLDNALNPRNDASVQKAGNILTKGTALFAGDEKASWKDLVAISKGNPVKAGKPGPTYEETAAAKCLVDNYTNHGGAVGDSKLNELITAGVKMNGVELNLKEMQEKYPAPTGQK